MSTKIKMLVKFQTTILLSIIVLMIFFSNPLSFAESIEIVIPEGANQPGCEESNSCFIPYEVTITVGDSITWINQDSSPHTVTAGDLFKDVDIIGLDYPNGFSSPLLGSGDSWTHTFDVPGTYPYFSMVGLWMTGIIIVESSGEPVDVVEEPKDVSPKSLSESHLFLDPLPTLNIVEGEGILISGQLITADGKPISGKFVEIETIDPSGNIFPDDAATNEDGVFLAESFIFVNGPVTIYAEFNGDEEFSDAFATMEFEVIIEEPSTSKSTSEPQTSGKPFFELPTELPIIGEIGGCLIATATFGSELAPQVQFLREIRDNTVMSTSSGASFMAGFNTIYYSFSPAIADLERQSPIFKEVVKIAITPLLSTLSLLNYVEIDSESEMLGYGIGIILLNIGMYFVAPAIIILKLKNRN